jgi:hypothetical protein
MDAPGCGTAADPSGRSRHHVQGLLDAEERPLQRVLRGLRAAGLDVETEAKRSRLDGIAGQHPADVASDTFEREVDFGLICAFAAGLEGGCCCPPLAGRR